MVLALPLEIFSEIYCQNLSSYFSSKGRGQKLGPVSRFGLPPWFTHKIEKLGGKPKMVLGRFYTSLLYKICLEIRIIICINISQFI